MRDTLPVRASVTALLAEGASGYVRKYPTDDLPPFKPLVLEAEHRKPFAPSSLSPATDREGLPLIFAELYELL